MSVNESQAPGLLQRVREWSSLSAWLVYASLALQGLTFWRTPIYDPDLGFHLLGGAWVDKYGEVPRRDFINILNATWVDYHWLGQWIIHLVTKTGDLQATQAICGVLGALLGVIIVAIVRTSSPGLKPLPALLLSTLSLAAIYGNISTRPTSMAVVLVASGFLAILKWQKRALWVLLVLTVLCANIHVYWILFSIMWAVAFGLTRLLPGKITRRYRASATQAWGATFALLATGLVSPYGIFNPEPGLSAKLINLSVVVDVAINPAVLKRFVMELQSGLRFHTVMFWFSLAAILFAANQLTVRRIRSKPFETALFWGTFLMFVEAIKYGVFFVISAAASSAPLLRKALRRSAPASKVAEALSPAVCVFPLVFLVLAWSTSPFREANTKAALDDLRYFQPIGACTAIRGMFPSPNKIVRVLSPYDFGGWCAWALNAEGIPSPYRLLMDGRTQFVPVQAIVDAFDVYSLSNEWEKTLAGLAPDAILVARDQPLGQLLFKSKDEWKLEYADEHFGVFLPRG